VLGSPLYLTESPQPRFLHFSILKGGTLNIQHCLAHSRCLITYLMDDK
jgi:hypothetical protein